MGDVYGTAKGASAGAGRLASDESPELMDLAGSRSFFGVSARSAAAALPKAADSFTRDVQSDSSMAHVAKDASVDDMLDGLALDADSMGGGGGGGGGGSEGGSDSVAAEVGADAGVTAPALQPQQLDKTRKATAAARQDQKRQQQQQLEKRLAALGSVASQQTDSIAPAAPHFVRQPSDRVAERAKATEADRAMQPSLLTSIQKQASKVLKKAKGRVGLPQPQQQQQARTSKFEENMTTEIDRINAPRLSMLGQKKKMKKKPSKQVGFSTSDSLLSSIQAGRPLRADPDSADKARPSARLREASHARTDKLLLGNIARRRRKAAERSDSDGDASGWSESDGSESDDDSERWGEGFPRKTSPAISHKLSIGSALAAKLGPEISKKHLVVPTKAPPTFDALAKLDDLDAATLAKMDHAPDPSAVLEESRLKYAEDMSRADHSPLMKDLAGYGKLIGPGSDDDEALDKEEEEKEKEKDVAGASSAPAQAGGGGGGGYGALQDFEGGGYGQLHEGGAPREFRTSSGTPVPPPPSLPPPPPPLAPDASSPDMASRAFRTDSGTEVPPPPPPPPLAGPHQYEYDQFEDLTDRKGSVAYPASTDFPTDPFKAPSEAGAKTTTHAYDQFHPEDEEREIGSPHRDYDVFSDLDDGTDACDGRKGFNGYDAMSGQTVSNARAENVYFSAFAPMSVARGSSFNVAINAYLRQQREEVLERARETGTTEKGIPNLLKLFRSSRVTVSLHLSPSFELSEPACGYSSFEWTGASQECVFAVMARVDAECGVAHECVATIVEGTQVAHMSFTLTVHQPTASQPSRLIDGRVSECKPTASDASSPLTELKSKFERVDPATAYSHIDLAELDIQSKIGVGYGFNSTAFVAKYEGRKVAVKTVPTSHLGLGSDGSGAGSTASSKALEHEGALLSMIGHHPNIVRFIGTAHDSTHAYIVSEYEEGGNLQERTSRGGGQNGRGPVSGSLACRLVRDAAAGLECSHAGRVLHNDVAARNCLLSTADLTSPGCVLKLADFGLSTLRPRHSHAEFIAGGDSQYPIGWMPPEALHPPYVFSEASDTYGLGCLIYELTSGERPWAGVELSEVRRLVGEGKKLEAPTYLRNTPTLKNLFDDCLATDASKRPTMKDVIGRISVAAGAGS